jgi:pantoate--beta-alanine ligase
VQVPSLAEILCGRSRPGFFDGVATVVTKLVNIVQPDCALFGEKDYQQLILIRRLVRDLNLPVEILAGPTVRESDGLALSSRNSYLSPEERAIAPGLHQQLQGAAEALRQGRDPSHIEREALAALSAAGFYPDYFSVRRASDLEPAEADDSALVILAAAHLGSTRLIDNLRVERQTLTS